MAKKGIYRISGNPTPKVLEKAIYKIEEWYPDTPISDRNPTKVTWELFIEEGGKFRTTHIKKKGISEFTFGKNAHKYTYKIEGYLHSPEGKSPMALTVKPQKNETKTPPKKDILGVSLTYQDGTKITKTLSYQDRLKATAKCQNLEGEFIIFELWEDDETKSGHNAKNQSIIKSPPIKVDTKGYARWNFTLLNTFIKLANIREDDKKKHEYYVTAEYSGKILDASGNVNVTNPEYTIPVQTKGGTKPKQPASTPPAKKPQPQPDSAKGSTHQGSKNNQPDKRDMIKSVKLEDVNGKPFPKRPKFGEKIKLIIESKGVKGKNYQLKIWEHDSTGDNDLLYNQTHTFKSDEREVLYITLTDAMQKIGEIGNNPKTPDSGEYWTGNYQEIFAEVIYLNKTAQSQTINVDIKAEAKKPENKKSTAQVSQPAKSKEKFEKVVGLGKEAVLYISSEIATEIIVDKNGKVTSYPDSGGYNSMDEYKENGKLYCKKLLNGKSAFPLYKLYIYRGNKIGEAVKKLKQDIENKTHENAESTVLTVARHAQENNKNYGSKGPIPPNNFSNLYRVRYMQAWNHAQKESFRYRFVDDSTSNLKPLQDFTKEVSNGAMTLGSRSSISIDPWNSNGLIGCLGIRKSNGETHPSCANEYPNQDKENYKFIYHALNNYLEKIIPELTGVYGRRGYSSNGKVAVKQSDYKEEIKVFVLVDPLPELNNCKLNLKKDGREEFYNEFGEAAIKMVDNHKKSNKFKGLYMVAQRRQENSFKLQVPNNNPMNIKGKGDLGSSPLNTHEYINGKKVYMTDGFANFSTIEKGFEGYLNLLQKNYEAAYDAILNDSRTIDDFLIGMQDKGKIGAYATDPNYKTLIKSIFNGVVKDYKEILAYKLCKEKSEDGKNKIKKDIELLNKLK